MVIYSDPACLPDFKKLSSAYLLIGGLTAPFAVLISAACPTAQTAPSAASGLYRATATRQVVIG